jgi:amino acid transporter
LSAGFPLALYMLIGWENGPALAEEARDPRRTIPRALYISIATGTALFVFSQARMLFDGGRSGLLPTRLGHVRPPANAPVNALATMAAIGLGLIAIWWASHLIGIDNGSTDPVGLYAEYSTMGTIVILFVYLLTTLSLPVFMWRRHRETFSALRHVAVPVLGALTLVVPFVELCKPGQPAPYSEFPYIALAIVVVASVIACIVVHRHPSTGSGEGAALSA